MYIHFWIEELTIIARIGNNPNVQGLMNNKEFAYTIEYYAALKKNKILPFTATQIKMAGIILNKINQKENYFIQTDLMI